MPVKPVPSIRLFVTGPLAATSEVVCGRSQSNYLRNVMRLKDGDEILVFDGQSGEWRANVALKGKRDCSLQVTKQERPQDAGPDVHYLFAPLKRARLDYMVQKATEMGVAALRPVITQRTDVSRVNMERARANVIEAAEQCGVLRLPDVHEPVSLGALLDNWTPERRIIFGDESAPVASPVDALAGIDPGPLAVLAGPEGGFDPQEREHLIALPYVISVSLGPRVMRADTAAVAILSLVNAMLGDWR